MGTKQKINKQTTLLHRETFHLHNNKAHKLVILDARNWVFTFEFIRSLLLEKEFSDFFLFVCLFCLGVMEQRRQACALSPSLEPESSLNSVLCLNCCEPRNFFILCLSCCQPEFVNKCLLHFVFELLPTRLCNQVTSSFGV
jgi:hypothetical protein